MALVPVVPMTIAAAIVDPEHTVDTSNNSADSRTNGAAEQVEIPDFQSLQSSLRGQLAQEG